MPFRPCGVPGFAPAALYEEGSEEGLVPLIGLYKSIVLQQRTFAPCAGLFPTCQHGTGLALDLSYSRT